MGSIDVAARSRAEVFQQRFESALREVEVAAREDGDFDHADLARELADANERGDQLGTQIANGRMRRELGL